MICNDHTRDKKKTRKLFEHQIVVVELILFVSVITTGNKFSHYLEILVHSAVVVTF